MEEFFTPNGTILEIFFRSYVVMFAWYLVVAGVCFLVLYVFLRRAYINKKIQSTFPKWSDIRREFMYSLVTLIFFWWVVVIVYMTPFRHMTQVYDHFSDRWWWYFFLSFVIYILYHDAYFYWTHRLLHHRWFMRFHRIHHMSHSPTPWAAFSFHPVEAIINSSVTLTIVLFLPVHIFTILLFYLCMTAVNVYGHLGFEMFGKSESTHWFWRWWLKTIYHDLHHERWTANFWFYFTWWDRMMGTFDGWDKKPRG